MAQEKEARLKQNAESIGVAAVKYFDLRQNRNSDYRFSYDSMLDPKGNTAVYVLYLDRFFSEASFKERYLHV